LKIDRQRERENEWRHTYTRAIVENRERHTQRARERGAEVGEEKKEAEPSGIS
jgi:hypothetical protein